MKVFISYLCYFDDLNGSMTGNAYWTMPRLSESELRKAEKQIYLKVEKVAKNLGRILMPGITLTCVLPLQDELTEDGQAQFDSTSLADRIVTNILQDNLDTDNTL